MKKVIYTAVLGTLLFQTGLTAAADIQQGKEKAKLCFACHGQNGQAPLPQYPNLSGQSAQYLELALKGYKNGSRTDMMMAPMAKVLSDADIANISAYFASIK
ncbi:c-type cytochrome [Thiomicrorhabdus cannonii]|uniref:c-type cytochrome n=1 Tax=Thiomicrorhabdus cannonii TaxID=2748011 RepID=UPI0015BEBB84|nr:cytochrome c [Thiomicrorhabdus cannonii]